MTLPPSSSHGTRNVMIRSGSMTRSTIPWWRYSGFWSKTGFTLVITLLTACMNSISLGSLAWVLGGTSVISVTLGNVGVLIVKAPLFKVSVQILQILFDPVWPKNRVAVGRIEDKIPRFCEMKRNADIGFFDKSSKKTIVFW
jgi:hypothetical protein